MKIKKINRIAIFSIAGLALGAVGFAGINQYVNNPNKDIGVFAASGSEISIPRTPGFTFEWDQDKRGSSFSVSYKGSLQLPNSTINNGDYISFRFVNANASVLNGREVKINNEVIGKFTDLSVNSDNSGRRFEDKTLLGSVPTTDIKLVFNEKANNHQGATLSIDADIGTNVAHSNKDWQVRSSLLINNNEVIGGTAFIKGEPLSSGHKSDIWQGRLDLISHDNGATFYGAHVGLGVKQHYKNPESAIKVGDILTWSLSTSSGASYNTDDLIKSGDLRVGQIIESKSHLPINRGSSNTNADGLIEDPANLTIKIKYKKLSPYMIVAEVVSAPSEGYRGDINVGSKIKTKLRDRSNNTIDYENNRLKPQDAFVTITRGGKQIFSDKQTAQGIITGSTLMAYSKISKTGSIIMSIQDTSGNDIEGYESDDVVVDNGIVGSSYNISIPHIPGYRFVKIGQGSAPLRGNVVEGVGRVIAIFEKINTIPQKVGVGENPDPKVHVPGFDNDFPGCSVRYKTNPDTSKAGTVKSTIVISCPGKDDQELVVDVIVVDKKSPINTIPQKVGVGENPDPKVHVPGFDNDFPGCSVRYKTNPDTSKAGTVKSTIVISCPGKDDQELVVDVIVVDNPSQKAPNTGFGQNQHQIIVVAFLAVLSTLSIIFKKK